MEFVEYDKYSYHYLRVLCDAFRTGDFSLFYGSLASDCIFTSDWNYDEIIGKEKILNHFNSIKGKSFGDIVYIHGKNYDYKNNEIVIGTDGDYFPEEKIELEEGDLCLLNSTIYGNIIDTKLFYLSVKNGKINLINATNEKRYIYEEFILPLTFNTMGDKRFPIFKEDNILSYQELCRASCVLADKILVNEYGFEILFSKSMLNQTINIIAEKAGKKVGFIIRGFHSKDLRDPGFNTPTGVLDRDVYEANLPDLREIKISKKYCDSINAELNIILFYFRSTNPDHKREGMYYRGDSYEDIRFNRLEKDDFEC